MMEVDEVKTRDVKNLFELLDETPPRLMFVVQVPGSMNICVPIDRQIFYDMEGVHESGSEVYATYSEYPTPGLVMIHNIGTFSDCLRSSSIKG